MEQDLARLRALFDEVMQAPPESRAALLTARCGADTALQRRVEALIATAEADEPFLSEPTRTKPPLSLTPRVPPGPLSERPGTRIGPYKLLQIIGEGGFGVVFMAEQDEPMRRRVALKIIKLGMDTRQVVARFEQERQALALMDHPNIARVFDAGATESGRPYFVMEYVIGDPITAFADAHKLSVRQRLDLFAQVCGAVQHAHTKGVIHRDIKPRNVLVSMVDGKPFAKVIDFGIAKATGARLTDKTLFTEHHQTIGTPEYMSPEQAEGSPDIDTRTDVYALGVMLYELLTGATPFDAKRLREAAYAEMQRIIKEEEPPAPSVRLSRDLATLAATAAARQADPAKLGPLIRGELDWIVMKALDKDRARRYETPNQLAADVQRHLSGEPVIAAPPSAAYRLRKFVRKHKSQVVATSLVLLTLIGGIAGTSWQAVRAKHAEAKTGRALENTKVALDESEWTAYMAYMGLTQNAIAGYDWPGARRYLSFAPEKLRGFEWNLLNNEAQSVVCEFPREHIVLSSDGSLALLYNEANIDAPLFQLRNAQNCEFICESKAPHSVNKAEFSPDNSRILVWNRGSAWLMDRSCRQIGDPLNMPSEFVRVGQFNPDGTRVAVGYSDGTLRLWNSDGKPMGVTMKHEKSVRSVAFSPDGTQILTTSEDKTARLWDLQGNPLCDSIVQDDEHARNGIFSPKGTVFLTLSGNKTARLWDLRGNQIGDAMMHDGPVEYAEFSPDGSRILTRTNVGLHSRAHLWDAEGHQVGTSIPHEVWNCNPRFTKDGLRIVTAERNRVCLWDLEGRLLAAFNGSYASFSVNPENTRIITESGGVARLWDLSSGRRLGERIYSDPANKVELTSDGKQALLGFGGLGYSGNVSAQRVESIDLSHFSGTQSYFPEPSHMAETIVLLGQSNHDVRSLGDTKSVDASARNSLLDPSMISAWALTPDGSRMVVARSNQSVTFVEPGSDRELAVFRVTSAVRDLAFTPDGRQLFLTLEDGSTQLWDSRDFETRSAEVAERWDARAQVKSWVDDLLAGPGDKIELERRVAEDKSRPVVERFAALDILREKLVEVDSEAEKRLEGLQKELLSKSQVLTAARRVEDVPGRVREALVKQIEEWKQDGASLCRACWTVVRSPKSPGERFALALEGASEAVAMAPGEPRSRMTLGAAKYLLGDFAGALEALTRSGELFTKELKRIPPRCLALMAITHHRLGHADEARDTLQQLRALWSGTDALKDTGEDQWDDDAKALLAEAEALIEGVSSGDSQSLPPGGTP